MIPNLQKQIIMLRQNHNSNNGGQYGRPYQNREQNNGQRNGYDQNRTTGYINQNNRNNGRYSTPPPVEKAQGNQNMLNTGASVRQMNQGPLLYLLMYPNLEMRVYLFQHKYRMVLSPC